MTLDIPCLTSTGKPMFNLQELPGTEELCERELVIFITQREADRIAEAKAESDPSLSQ